ncbi:MAG: hypothetical protein HQK88_00470 [Nitrospirae bacterium]|nr:hypothetical protein [Nitrospirota bacterium]MBF0535252.1 hypothetical protein [Nitrospirota bacterium]MBF0615268.1 hypothetical protein [Nitrospirota bacterium]
MNCWEIKKCSEDERSACPVFIKESDVVNCWDVLKCEESKRNACVAFINNNGQECWKLTGTLCHGNVIDEFKEKIKQCRKCEFFTKYAKRPM